MIHLYYSVALDPQAEKFDMAVLPVDQYGSVGKLNSMVLKTYGYSDNILQMLDLSKGYSFISEGKKKPLLFVVTIGSDGKTDSLVRLNLYNALSSISKLTVPMSIWIPLLGTGTGGLNFFDSWRAVSSVLNDLASHFKKSNFQLTVAIPNDREGMALFDDISHEVDFAKSENLFYLAEKSGRRFYLLEITVNTKEDLERFHRDGIWKTADNRYQQIINEINYGDFLIVKSHYEIERQKNFLRFLGWGRVTGNPKNGQGIGIELSEGLHETDIRGMGYMRDIVSRLNQSEFDKILSDMPPVTRKSMVDWFNFHMIQEHQPFAGLVSDSDTGTDYLEITPDVNAFSLVLAAKSFQPPLAAALLGKWGSGKSFFMKKLRSRIEELSATDSTYFCEGIVHVHFNAWSYMDANLWSSITTNIFDQLNDYIRKDDRASRYKKKIEKKITENLSVTKEEITVLKHQRQEIDGQLRELKSEKERIGAELKGKINSLRIETLLKTYEKTDKKFNVEERIAKAVTSNPGIKADMDYFKKIVPVQYWVSPEKLYDQAKRLPVLMRHFTTGKEAVFNWFWLLGAIAIIVLVPIALDIFTDFYKYHTISLISKAWLIIAPIGAFYTQSARLYKKHQPFLAALWTIKEEHLKVRKAAFENFEQAEKALIQEIDYKKNELDSINAQITSVKIVRSAVEYKITNALSTAALHDFIEKRCSSDDYKKHLGLISVIRKDFEVLSALFTGHSKELKESGNSEEFRKLFDKPLERIILYIDDLDRCPEDRVIEVLEAVNLLMAFPLFVVVVGVDPGWVKNALTVKYKRQFTENDSNYVCMEPSDYLEKIFQIAFRLKTAENSSIKNMLRELSAVRELPGSAVENSTVGDHALIEEDDREIIDEIRSRYNGSVVPPDTISKETIVKALNFEEDEVKSIEDMSYILGSNPRLLKRFINIYRIIKSHENIRSASLNIKDMQCILLLLALLFSRFRPLVYAIFEEMAFTGIKSASLKTVTSFGFVESEDERIKQLRDELKEVLSESNEELLDIKISDLKRHLQFIERFSF